MQSKRVLFCQPKTSLINAEFTDSKIDIEILTSACVFQYTSSYIYLS